MILFHREEIKITPLTLLVLLGIALRIPSLFEPYWYGDEAIYLTLGEGIRQGLLLYRDIFDHKPPLIYLLAAIAGSVFWFKFILLVWNTVAIILFWKLAKNFLAALLFVLVTSLPLLEGNIANAELFILGPTLGAYLLLSNQEKITPKRVFLAGILLSLSILFKVPAVFDLFVVIVFWGVSVRSGATFQRAFFNTLILFAGVSMPILISMVYFAWHHALGAYLTTAWSDNFTYIGRWGSATAQKTPLFSLNGLPARALITSLVLGLIFVFRKAFTPSTLFIVIWLTLSLFASLISARPYPHYLIQVAPALCLAIAVVYSGRLKVRFLPLPFILLVLLAVIYYRFSYYPILSYYQNFAQLLLGQKTKDQYINYFDSRMSRVYKLSTALQNRTSLKERVFIWGTAPEVYALSRRLPPTRYVTSFHITDFGGGKETLEALSKNKPEYIVVLPEEDRSLPGFFSFLQNNYFYIKNIEGAQFWKLVKKS
ncbi:MAG: hypothetical protein A2782_04570 [Candidatus Blackburnbacteria bacterium RIFCSPHIGHO2_01_FULL_43_15b]|uniref:Glycosyltransferase RgtA/B/C/D-like domain-containing protein n=1 Tax=Candidatus Blackburnbacteria bacterium RIFCSPHIGHO2_01_FULL_43_15b TaxID=1797513 RepID=A0A1G1V3J6_9BACT|nr:MAG: hypothetical protein A2782_04570 [Candidatus Blackburnbacteria bacterium RIFCSPHIGHO2_01_FULL_43_15b]